jgi:SNF family Na+-dependent transporter
VDRARRFGVLSCFLIMTFYLVVAGWALKYFSGAATGLLWQRARKSMAATSRTSSPTRGSRCSGNSSWRLGAVTVVAAGVRAGIERLTRVVTPLLALIVLLLAIRGLTLPGGGPGLAFLFRPDWRAARHAGIYLAAIGQAFFSLSLGLGLYVTYGSYLGSEHRLPGAVSTVVAGDTMMAVLSGIAIFPAVFAFGLDPASGPQARFHHAAAGVPRHAGGEYVGALFFFLLAAAALSASISGVEIPTAYVMRRLRWPRRRAAIAGRHGDLRLRHPRLARLRTVVRCRLAGATSSKAPTTSSPTCCCPRAGCSPRCWSAGAGRHRHSGDRARRAPHRPALDRFAEVRDPAADRGDLPARGWSYLIYR